MSLQRSSSSRTQYLSTLRNRINEVSGPKGGSQRQDDTSYWKPELDKTGTGSAVIRFLPTKSGEEFPFVQLYTHGFQGPSGKWFIDNCPVSLGGMPSEVCPVCAENHELWNASNDKEDPKKKLASARKKKLSYISNILVINDPKHPENNGKIFKYRYGKKIFEKIKDLISPPAEFADMEPLDPFDPYEGANFKLRITKQDGFPNYDKSTFDNGTALFDGDEDKIAGLLQGLFSLNEILDPKNFKTFDALKKRFEFVVGESGDSAPAPATKPALEDEFPKTTRTAAPKPVGRTATPKAEPAAEEEGDDFFATLARQSPDEE
jgi:hypothetical protein